MKLNAIQVKNSHVEIDTIKLVQTACRLPPPQDIRHALFSLSAQQSSLEIFKEHLASLKKHGNLRNTFSYIYVFYSHSYAFAYLSFGTSCGTPSRTAHANEWCDHRAESR